MLRKVTKKLTIVSITISLLLTGGLVLAQEYPQPEEFVTDIAEIISPAKEAELEALLYQFEQDTTNEIAVVTIPDLEGLAIEQYTFELAEEWAIGKEGRDNGVVLLVAPNERKVRIEVGYGLEGAIPDATAFGIIQSEILPDFKLDNYENGITNGINGIIRASKDEVYAQDIATSEYPEDLVSQIFTFGFIFFNFFALFLVRVLGRTKSWWLGGAFGAIAGIIIYIFANSLWFLIILLTIIGLFIDFVLSKSYKKHGRKAWWYHMGGGKGGKSSSGFGGFGGGSFGGGGASGSW